MNVLNIPEDTASLLFTPKSSSMMLTGKLCLFYAWSRMIVHFFFLMLCLKLIIQFVNEWDFPVWLKCSVRNEEQKCNQLFPHLLYRQLSSTLKPPAAAGGSSVHLRGGGSDKRTSLRAPCVCLSRKKKNRSIRDKLFCI